MEIVSLPPLGVLKKTKSKCNACGTIVPAEAVKVSANGRTKIILRKHCAVHGPTESDISADARFYYKAQGHPSNRGCGCSSGSCSSIGGGKDGFVGSNEPVPGKEGIIEELKTCLALIEIVDSCNLTCPTCFSKSPLGSFGENLKARSFEDITNRVQAVIDRKGPIEVLQLSGGEPTIHPDLFRIIDWVREHKKIDYLLINTNGVRLAKNGWFVERLGDAFKRHRKIQLYLQFDGPQIAGQKELRGMDLRSIRERAIKNCGEVGLPITLAMTVTRSNLDHLWDTIEFARPFPHVRGVSFQPMFLSGRNPANKDNPPTPITIADIILGVHEQSNGFVRVEDFTPLPCGDPNCANIGWLFRMKGEFYSPTEYGVDVAKLQSQMPDRVQYRLEDLEKCGCDGTELGELMKLLELEESNAFRFFIKPFMDWYTWDEDRIDRCCTHVIRPDGKLDSFCRYYAEQPLEIS